MNITKENILEKAKHAKHESKYVEFKSRFDPNSSQDWCEIIKDIIAISNSGGGCILIGANNDGSPSGYDITSVIKLDPAIITDKIAKYTEIQFSDFEIEEIEKEGHKIAVFIIYPAEIPIIFTDSGIYITEKDKQKTAFQKGTIYFRHGAKSEPGNNFDLEKAIERKLKNIKKEWLSGIKKVITAPVGHTIQVLPTYDKISGTTLPIRITTDKKALKFKLETTNDTHPNTQKDVIKKVNERLKNKQINQYDILCVKKVYGINEHRPDFYYKPICGSAQYSEKFIDWLVNSFQKNPSFFDKAREKYKQERIKNLRKK